MMLCELSSLSAKNQQTATDSRAVTDVFQYRRLLSYIEIGNIHTSVNILVNVSRKQFQNLESLQIYCTRSLTFQLGQFSVGLKVSQSIPTSLATKRKYSSHVILREHRKLCEEGICYVE